MRASTKAPPLTCPGASEKFNSQWKPFTTFYGSAASARLLLDSLKTGQDMRLKKPFSSGQLRLSFSKVGFDDDAPFGI
jgi:hypothetical protein